MNRRKLALLCAAMFVLAGLGSAFAASSASAMTIIIRSKLGPIRDEIIIGKIPSETTSALATGGNTFQGVSKSGVPCHSQGAAAGEVKTVPTTLELGYINAKKKQIAVGLEERPTSGTLYAKFECGTELVEWRGATIAALSPINKTIKEGSSLTADVNVGSTGKDEVTHFEGGPQAVMEEQVNGGGFHEIAFQDEATLSPAEGSIKVKGKGTAPPQFELKSKKPKK